MSAVTASARKTVAADDPFFFFGQGFSTSKRCLEGFLWHARPPSAPIRARIVASLPFAVSSFARFDGELLHFGSDDDLEARVCAAHHPDYADLDPRALLEQAGELPDPGRREWRAFNCAFEHAVLGIHSAAPLVAVIKPDDGAYGRTFGRWHRRSVARAHELAAIASQRPAPPTTAWSAMAMNLLEDVLPSADDARRLRTVARSPWIAWLDRLVSSGDRSLREAFVERLSWVLEALRGRSHAEAIATLTPATRRHLDALATIDLDNPTAETRATARERSGMQISTTPNQSTKSTMAKKTATKKKTSAKRTPPSSPASGDPAKMMRSAIAELVIPALRSDGLDGGYPNLRRTNDKHTHVMWFSLDKSMNGRAQVEVAKIASRDGTSVKDDYHRAIDVRNRKRKLLTELAPHADAALFWYEDAATHWGDDWPSELAALLLRLLREHADRWWGGQKR